jgi:hypothetical protein
LLNFNFIFCNLIKHKDPDYSAAYVVIKTDRSDGLSGYGLAFTLGRGTEIGGLI